MEKKNGYDAVVFDMDGVIFDSERAVMQCWITAWPTGHMPRAGGIEGPEGAAIAASSGGSGNVIRTHDTTGMNRML